MCSLTDFESDSVGIMFKVGLFVEAAQRAMVPGTPSSSDTVTSRSRPKPTTGYAPEIGQSWAMNAATPIFKERHCFLIQTFNLFVYQ